MDPFVKIMLLLAFIVGYDDLTRRSRAFQKVWEMQPLGHAEAKKKDLFAKLSAECDRDLRKLDSREADKLLADLESLIPDRTQNTFRPWYLWSLGNKEEPRILLFEARDFRGHPGSTEIRLTEFDPSGTVLAHTTFDTGWRRYLTGGVNLACVGGGHVVVLGTCSWPNDRAYIEWRQYYARNGKRYDLVRIEEAGGDAVRNTYYIKHFCSGPPVPTQNAAQWEVDLLSSDRPRILRTLVWLGGLHWDLKPGGHPVAQYESREEAELVHEVRMREKVIVRLKELAVASDRWLRDEARLALKSEDRR